MRNSRISLTKTRRTHILNVAKGYPLGELGSRSSPNASGAIIGLQHGDFSPAAHDF